MALEHELRENAREDKVAQGQGDAHCQGQAYDVAKAVKSKKGALILSCPECFDGLAGIAKKKEQPKGIEQQNDDVHCEGFSLGLLGRHKPADYI